jgi:hypothetical protein
VAYQSIRSALQLPRAADEKEKEFMRSRAYWIAILMAIVFLSLFGWSMRGQGSSKTVWEYKYVKVGDNNLAEKQLNELGAQGWELVTVVPRMSEGINYDGGVYYLKRAN